MQCSFRSAFVLVACGYATFQGIGCANFVETRSIEQFTAALEADNVKKLRSTASTKFEHKALRLEDSLEDFKAIRFPKGKNSIVKVEEISPDEKDVTVAVGDSNRKLKYRLTHDPERDKWVVDDILLRTKQNKITKTESVSKRMDLLLTVREFLNAWDSGRRDEVLAVTSDEFRQSLSDLPPVYLARLTKQVVGKQAGNSKRRPKDEIEDDVAVVRLPGASGEMVISFESHDDGWKISDITIESRSDRNRIPSVRRLAEAVATAVNFLGAYQRADKDAMASVSTAEFVRSCLAHADLSLVSLPDTDLMPDDHEIKVHGNRAYFTVKGQGEVITISMARDSGRAVGLDESDESDKTESGFLVDEVTIYELEGTQEKRLSALFTAHAIVQIFSDAMAARDVPALVHSATPDFQRVWRRLSEHTIRDLPLDSFDKPPHKILATDFQGATTEVTVMQGSRVMAYVLQFRHGQLLVDDVLAPLPNRPSSLKQNLELIIPIREFASGLRLQKMELLQRNSSKNMNEFVWYQTKSVPETVGPTVAQHLRGTIRSIEAGPDQATVSFGVSPQGSKVHLVKEGAVFVIDDIEFSTGTDPNGRKLLKQTMRQRLAGRERRGARRSQSEDEVPALQSLDSETDEFTGF